jgi:hypothetical protein
VQKERVAAAGRARQESQNSAILEDGTPESDSSNGSKERRRPVTSDGPRHPRMSSWRGGRSTLSDGEGIGGPADLEEVPVGVKRQALRLEDYAFPEHRLRTVMDGSILLITMC